VNSGGPAARSRRFSGDEKASLQITPLATAPIRYRTVWTLSLVFKPDPARAAAGIGLPYPRTPQRGPVRLDQSDHAPLRFGCRQGRSSLPSPPLSKPAFRKASQYRVIPGCPSSGCEVDDHRARNSSSRAAPASITDAAGCTSGSPDSRATCSMRSFAASRRAATAKGNAQAKPVSANSAQDSRRPDIATRALLAEREPVCCAFRGLAELPNRSRFQRQRRGHLSNGVKVANNSSTNAD